jgi:hypothetical protein
MPKTTHRRAITFLCEELHGEQRGYAARPSNHEGGAHRRLKRDFIPHFRGAPPKISRTDSAL